MRPVSRRLRAGDLRSAQGTLRLVVRTRNGTTARCGAPDAVLQRLPLPGGTAQRGRSARTLATLPFPVPSDRGGSHGPRPTTIVGSVTIAVTWIVGLALVQSAIALSGTFVWISLAVTALVVFVAVVVYRRAQAASNRSGRGPLVRARASPVETAAWISRRRRWSARSIALRPSGLVGAQALHEGRGPTVVDPLLLATTLVDRTSEPVQRPAVDQTLAGTPS
jgi:hypothetical protein